MPNQPEINASTLQSLIESEISKQFPGKSEGDEGSDLFDRMDQQYIESQLQRKMRLQEKIAECNEEIEKIDKILSMFNRNSKNKLL